MLLPLLVSCMKSDGDDVWWCFPRHVGFQPPTHVCLEGLLSISLFNNNATISNSNNSSSSKPSLYDGIFVRHLGKTASHVMSFPCGTFSPQTRKKKILSPLGSLLISLFSAALDSIYRPVERHGIHDWPDEGTRTFCLSSGSPGYEAQPIETPEFDDRLLAGVEPTPSPSLITRSH